MASNPFFNTVYGEVTADLEQIVSEEKSALRMAERSIRSARSGLERIRHYVVEHPFPSEGDEIHFFKVEKPMLTGKLIYYLKLYRIESRRPIGSLELQTRHFATELHNIDQFFINHQDFYHYYRSGATFLDEFYFLRGKQDLPVLMDLDWVYADPTFSTGFDLLLGEMHANDSLVQYINEAVRSVQKASPADTEAEERGRESGGRGARYFVQTPYKGAEVYVILKAFIDSQAIVNHTYKSFFELVVPAIANMQQKSFAPGSLLKYSDKVDPETRENAKRLLQKMIRNIDTY
jgi:hypothetical protein